MLSRVKQSERDEEREMEELYLPFHTTMPSEKTALPGAKDIVDAIEIMSGAKRVNLFICSGGRQLER